MTGTRKLTHRKVRSGSTRKLGVGLRRREAWSAVRRIGSIRTRAPCRKPGIHSIDTAGTMHWRHGGIDVPGQKQKYSFRNSFA